MEITADEDVVTERLLKRAQIEGREDDTEDVIRKRLAVYAEKTAPVTAFYAGQGRPGASGWHRRGRRGHRADSGGGRGPLGAMARDRIQYKSREQMRVMARAGVVVERGASRGRQLRRCRAPPRRI